MVMNFKVLLLLLLQATVTSSASAAEPPITAVVFAPNGESLIAASQSGLQIYGWPDLQRRKTIECEAANLHCVAFSPDGKHLTVGGGTPSEDGSVEVFSWPTCQRVSLHIEHVDSVQSVAWQSSTSLLSAGIDRQIKIFDLAPSGNRSKTTRVSPQPTGKENNQTFDVTREACPISACWTTGRRL